LRFVSDSWTLQRQYAYITIYYSVCHLVFVLHPVIDFHRVNVFLNLTTTKPHVWTTGDWRTTSSRS